MMEPTATDMCAEPYAEWTYSNRHLNDPEHFTSCYVVDTEDEFSVEDIQIAEDCETGEYVNFWQDQCFAMERPFGTRGTDWKKRSFEYHCAAQDDLWDRTEHIRNDKQVLRSGNSGTDNGSEEWYMYAIGLMMVVLLLFVCGLYAGYAVYNKKKHVRKETIVGLIEDEINIK